jgi:hypothetical protein
VTRRTVRADPVRYARIPEPGTGRPSVDQLFRNARNRAEARALVALVWPANPAGQPSTDQAQEQEDAQVSDLANP